MKIKICHGFHDLAHFQSIPYPGFFLMFGCNELTGCAKHLASLLLCESSF